MSVEVGRGHVAIVPELKGFQDKVASEVETAASKASARAQKAIDVGSRLTVGVTVPIAAAFGGAIALASDLEQSVGAVEAVFGSAADSVFELSDNSARAVGLAKADYQNMAAIVGSQLQNMGFDTDEAVDKTNTLITVAADLAAQYGGSTAEAIEAVSSLLRGERDPIEKYAVSIKQADVEARTLALGLDTSTTAAEKNAEAVATLDILMEQTASAQGAFNREIDTAAGSMQIAQASIKDAAAEIGSNLLPIVADAAGFVADLSEKFGDLPEGVQTTITVAGGLAAAVGPALWTFGRLSQAMAGLRDETGKFSWGKVSDGAKVAAGLGIALGAIEAAEAGVNKLLDKQWDGSGLANIAETLARTGESAVFERAIGGVDGLSGALEALARPGLDEGIDATLGAMSGGLFNMNTDMDQAQALMGEFDSALSGLVSSGNTEAAQALFEQLATAAEKSGVPIEDLIVQWFPQFQDALADTGSDIAEFTNGEIQDLPGKIEGAGKGMELFAKGAEAAEDAAPGATGEIDAMAGVVDRMAATWGPAIEGADDYRVSVEAQEEAVEKAREAHQELLDQLRAAVDPVFALEKAVTGLRDAHINHEEAVDAVAEAEKAVTEARKEHGKGSDEYKEAVENLEAAQRAVEDASWDVATATSNLEQAALNGEISFEDFEARLRTWVEQGHLTEAQAADIRDRTKDMRTEAEKVRGEYPVEFPSNVASQYEEMRDLYNLLGRIDRLDPHIRITTSGGHGGGAVLQIPGRGQIPLAAGGRAEPDDGPYMVGEAGWETFVPDTPGRVVSHADSVNAITQAVQEAMGSGGSSQPVSVTVNYPPNVPAEESVARALRRLAYA